MPANEIMLLNYYIPAINTESVFDEIFNGDETAFCLMAVMIVSRRIRKCWLLRLVATHPILWVRENKNDNNQNVYYDRFEKQITETYIKNSHVREFIGALDSYIKVFQRESDWLGKQGVIGCVSSGGCFRLAVCEWLMKFLL